MSDYKFNGEKVDLTFGTPVDEPMFGLPKTYDPIGAAPVEEEPIQIQAQPAPIEMPPQMARIVERRICCCGHPLCQEGPFTFYQEYA
jgi:hypothetical protein